jgi:hypothetical protein
MFDTIYSIVVSGLERAEFIKLLPDLEMIETDSYYPWPDCRQRAIAIAETNGFILAAGSILELIGEGLALEASRNGSALYLSENPDSGHYCAARFVKRKTAGRVEVVSWDIVDDSMGMFSEDSEDIDDKHYGTINTHEMLVDFIGANLTKIEWTHYASR